MTTQSKENMKRIGEGIAIILVCAFFLMLLLGFIGVMFLGMNYIFSQTVCAEEGYNLYRMGTIFPKSSPICEYLNETTMDVEYIKLNNTKEPEDDTRKTNK